MLRCCSLIVLCTLALNAHAQTEGVVRVEPFAGVWWGEPSADGGEYRTALTGGVRILKMYRFDRGVYLEGWLLRSGGDAYYCCSGQGTYTRVALLAGVSSTLIDRNATGGRGLRILAGLGVLRVDFAPDPDSWRRAPSYESVLDTWNAAFSGSMAYEVELARGMMLQVEAGYLILYVLHGNDSMGYDDGFLESFWAPAFRAVAGIAFEL